MLREWRRPLQEAAPIATRTTRGVAPSRVRRRAAALVPALLAAAVAAVLAAQAPPAERIPHFAANAPANIAHAGAQGHAPGNTLPAFELALELGADTLEMDLQLTADDEVVVHHDGTVDRGTDGTGAIRGMTLDEIRELDAGHGFEGPDGDFPYRGRGVRIPTLEEVFEAFPDEFLVLEMKLDGGREIIPAVAERVRDGGREDSIVVASFSLDYLREFRTLLPGVATNMPEDETRDFYWRHLLGLDRWYAAPAELFQLPEVHEGQRLITPNFLAAVDRRGLDAQVWTVNDPDRMRRLVAMGVQGIMTDYPDRLAEVLAEREAGEPIDDHPGLGFVTTLQERLAWLTAVMRALTVLGDEDFYVLVFPLLFWAVSARLGLQLGLLLLVSAGLNETLKLAFATPRPGFLAPGTALVPEATFGIPSGHAQNGVAVWGFLAAHARRLWAWGAAVALMLALGLSRVMLGVHFPQDTLVGWAVGAVLLAAFLRWRAPVGAWLAARLPRTQVLLGLAASAGLVLLGGIARVTLSAWELPAAWLGVGVAGWPADLGQVVTPAGALFGVVWGYVWQRDRGGFSAGGPAWQRVARCAVGLVGVVLLWQGLGAAFPRGEDPVALVLRFVRYASVGFWTGAVPRLFVRLGLADEARVVPHSSPESSCSAPDNAVRAR